MSNTYFKFKEFIIHQDKCAMKVSTDACIFGAWITTNGTKALDIGTGTGLLSLMLAQRFANINIDAIEINEEAYLQASNNIKESKYASRINVINKDIKELTNKNYDFIFTNPPFFENDLKSPNPGVNLAKHATALTLQELLNIAQQLLLPNGMLAVIIPKHRGDDLLNEATKINLHLQQKLLIQHNINLPFNKEIHVYGYSYVPSVVEELIIKNLEGIYTHQMLQLMQPYYL